MEQIEAYRILIDIRRIIDRARIIVECNADISSETIEDFRIIGDLAKSIEAYSMITKDKDFILEVERTQRYSLHQILSRYVLDCITRDSLISCLRSLVNISPQYLTDDEPKSLLEACLNKDSASITIIQEQNEDNTSETDSKPESPKTVDEILFAGLLQLTIKELEIRKLFKPKLSNRKKEGTNLSEADIIISSLKIPRNSMNIYAAIAKIFYESKFIERDEMPFNHWLLKFYDLLMLDKKTLYKLNSSRIAPSQDLLVEFQYLF